MNQSSTCLLASTGCSIAFILFSFIILISYSHDTSIATASYLVLIPSLIFFIIIMGFFCRTIRFMERRSTFDELSDPMEQDFCFRLIVFRVSPAFLSAMGIILTSIAVTIWQKEGFYLSRMIISVLCFVIFIPTFILSSISFCYSLWKKD